MKFGSEGQVFGFQFRDTLAQFAHKLIEGVFTVRGFVGGILQFDYAGAADGKS